MNRSSESTRAARPAWLALAMSAAFLIGIGSAGALRAQPAAPAREPGNFDPQPGPSTATPSTSGSQTAAPARRGGARRGGRGPAVTAHSPRDEGNHWTPSNFNSVDPKLPTLVVAGDSTASTGDPNHRGWGAVMIDYFDLSKINVVNTAIGGTSFRTFYREGNGPWKKVVDNLKAGDYVIIEFGHNDGGAPSATPGGGPDRSRGDVPGIGDNTVTVTTSNGTSETVHSYGWYTRKFIQDVEAKGAHPIVSTTTTRNMWSQDNKVERGMGHMLDWAKQVAEQEKVPYVDHSDIIADRYEAIGFDAVQKFHPADHTHTSTDGAILNAETMIAGLKGIKDMPLTQYLNDKGKAIEAATPKDAWGTYAPPAPLKGN